MENLIKIPGFKSIPKTGVIYVTDRAEECGYHADDITWANLGQGSPEVGYIPGALNRMKNVKITEKTNHYSPILGTQKFRQAVANFYNQSYRKQKKSQYTYENVAISNGGRAALTRIIAVLGNINFGHFIPDYTAYEELLSIFKAFTPIPILTDCDSNFQISNDQLKQEILGRGLNAILLSNPCNPTGQIIKGNKLKEWVNIARDLKCSIIFDEFYSHYIYDNKDTHSNMVSSAAYVDDVNYDPIIIIDGLTKNWRYPGFRLGWTLGPKSLINAIGSAGSFIDGGPNHPFQYNALHLLDVKNAQKETLAIQKLFRKKRDYILTRLRNMGIIVHFEPQGTFYIWADLSKLPKTLQNATTFFEEGLKEKVITIPGIFFDINPQKRRLNAHYQSYCRISFGPNIKTIKRGLNSIERLIKKHL